MTTLKDIKEKDLEKIFYFFHKKHKNRGDLDKARWPSDACHYILVINKEKFYIEIEEREVFKSCGEGHFPKICTQQTKRAVRMYKNFDFDIGDKVYTGEYDHNTYHKQEFRTYNILKFYKFLKSLGYKISI